MKGVWYVDLKYGISLNEGATPLNLTILFPWGWNEHWFIYIYFFGRRFHS